MSREAPSVADAHEDEPDDEATEAQLEALRNDGLSRIRHTISVWSQEDPATDQIDVAAMLRELADEYDD